MTTNVKRHSAHRLAIYSHKGGVGKTTLTVNIAAGLASLGKNVLLVDADPQCNLSAYLVDASVVDDLLDHSSEPDGATIWSALKPISEGTGDVRVVKPIELSLANAYLLPGDILLSEFERDLTQSWSECFEGRVKGFRGTTALSLLVNRLAVKYQIDFVFYDLGPNIGPVSRVAMLDCDYFIIPAACDSFSIRALKTLGRTVAGWIKTWEAICALAPNDVYLLPGRPKFLGYIPQRFRVYRGQVTAGQASYLSRIEKNVASEIVAVLRNVDSSLASNSMAENRIGLIKDFGTLATQSQAQGVPIHEVAAGTPDQRAEARKAFSDIARKIVQRTTKK